MRHKWQRKQNPRYASPTTNTSRWEIVMLERSEFTSQSTKERRRTVIVLSRETEGFLRLIGNSCPD